jgi:hypothetical protein
MPIELKDGQVLLTDAERQEYRAAADLLAEVDGCAIDLQSPMLRGDLVDLILAYYVVLNDEEALQQIGDLFEAEVARRRGAN